MSLAAAWVLAANASGCGCCCHCRHVLCSKHLAYTTQRLRLSAISQPLTCVQQRHLCLLLLVEVALGPGVVPGRAATPGNGCECGGWHVTRGVGGDAGAHHATPAAGQHKTAASRQEVRWVGGQMGRRGGAGSSAIAMQLQGLLRSASCSKLSCASPHGDAGCMMNRFQLRFH